MAVDRNEGYRRGIPLELPGIQYVQRFLRDVLGLDSELIEGEINRTEGDLRLANGVTAEVKRQNISPERYDNNFIELFENTGKDDHEGGFVQVAEMLGISADRLSTCNVTEKRVRIGQVGMLTHASNSLSFFEHARCIFYVNPIQPRGFISVYSKAEFVEKCVAVLHRGLFLGDGASNEITYAVYAPYSELTFKCAEVAGRLVLDTDETKFRMSFPSIEWRMKMLRQLLG